MEKELYKVTLLIISVILATGSIIINSLDGSLFRTIALLIVATVALIMYLYEKQTIHPTIRS